MDFWKEFNNSCSTLFAAMFGGTVALFVFAIITSLVILTICVISLIVLGKVLEDIPQSTLLLWRL